MSENQGIEYKGIVYGEALARSQEFKSQSRFQPSEDQAQAIKELTDGIGKHLGGQVLLGVTGSGKTFTMAKVIEKMQRPALILSHNKTLAAQLYQEFRNFFPENAVEYFVSYYDYYQPEAYIASTDTYIEKDVLINDEIDRLRHSATRALFERRDCIIVCSVSCIYGLGSPEAYYGMILMIEKGDRIQRREILASLVGIQYVRSDYNLERGTFRVRGDVIEIVPCYDELGIRIELFGDEVESIFQFDVITGEIVREHDRVPIYPRSHYVMPKGRWNEAFESIKAELEEYRTSLETQNRLVEAQRIHERTMFDLEMIKTVGYCRGIENYSRHLTGRDAGEPPPTLLDYLPQDALIFIDESHVTTPQVRGMFAGDQSRKRNLIEFGFRLPSALDNRPLNFDEFCKRAPNPIYVSATPGEYELESSNGVIVEQVIRPTGLMDPEILVRPVKDQIDDLLEEIRKRVILKERVLVTTLTKRMSEELTEYYTELGVSVRYLHSEIDTMDRIKILRDLRLGTFDVLVGVNLLREGLDLPEVSLVAILDADKEGFLRSSTSLIQTVGRAARNLNGMAIMYADRITGSMQKAIEETSRRRDMQQQHNKKFNITPESILKPVNTALLEMTEMDYYSVPIPSDQLDQYQSTSDVEKEIGKLRDQMTKAAADFRFEEAAQYRDHIRQLRETLLELSQESSSQEENHHAS